MRRALQRLVVLSSAVLALAVAPSVAAAGITPTVPAVVDGGAAKSSLVGGTYRLDTGLKATCPATSTDRCSVKVVVSALTHPATGAPKFAIVATGALRVQAGQSLQATAKVNAVGAREFKVRGSFLANVAVVVSNPASTARHNGEQRFLVPPRVLDAETTLTKVDLAPSQRLVLRLTGESASTGYAWKITPQTSTSVLRQVSSRAYPDPSCAPGTVGCFSIREIVYLQRGVGTSHVSVGLYGPTPETDATVRIDLDVTTHALPLEPKRITAAANGGRVVLMQGQELVVRLTGESASTGFAWKPFALTGAANVQLVANTPILSSCAAMLVGCPRERQLTYVNLRPGSTLVRAGLFGPGTTSPAKRFGVTVITR